MIKCLLLIAAFVSSWYVYSQDYKTICIEKGKKLSGIVHTYDMPNKTPVFSLITTGKGAFYYIKDSVIIASNKVLRFQINTKDYRHRDILFLNLKTKNKDIFTTQTPLLSAYFNTDSITNRWKRYNYNHTMLQSDHVLSVEIDTSASALYIVLVFPQTFSGKFKFELTSKVKPAIPPIKSRLNFNGKLYFHSYDYVKQPLPFMEAVIFSKQREWIQGSIKLENPAFEEPAVTPGTDSLFFNELMNNILAIKKEGKFNWFDNYPDVLFQMKFDQEGRLLDVQLSLFGSVYEEEEEILQNLELIRPSVPKHFAWLPAKNMCGQNIAYTREFLIRMDFYWN